MVTDFSDTVLLRGSTIQTAGLPSRSNTASQGSRTALRGLSGPTPLTTLPSAIAWVSLALLAILCTGLAYILYFRLIVRTGPTNAAAVTFLIPAFAAVFGWLFLGEAITPSMLIGGAVILAGTALAMGLLPRGVPLAQRA